MRQLIDKRLTTKLGTYKTEDKERESVIYTKHLPKTEEKVASAILTLSGLYIEYKMRKNLINQSYDQDAPESIIQGRTEWDVNALVNL